MQKTHNAICKRKFENGSEIEFLPGGSYHIKQTKIFGTKTFAFVIEEGNNGVWFCLDKTELEFKYYYKYFNSLKEIRKLKLENLNKVNYI